MAEGLYSTHILPRGVALVMGSRKFAAHRAPALRHTSGRVLELGFGAGHNLAHYPPAVTEVLALEPATLNRRLARKRIAASPLPVEWVGLRGEEIPLDDGSVDAVASTWTMCTIPDLSRALAEVRRVLRPGGALHFVEHGLAADEKTARRQHRWNRLANVVCGGCNLNRRFDVLLADAGFEVRGLEHPVLAGPRVAGYLYRGAAYPAD